MVYHRRKRNNMRDILLVTGLLLVYGAAIFGLTILLQEGSKKLYNTLKKRNGRAPKFLKWFGEFRGESILGILFVGGIAIFIFFYN